MKIVVIGGTGLIGSKTIALLGQRGHELIAASPSSGVNTLTGQGLAEVLQGAEVVLDLANSPSFEDAAVLQFFEISGRNLLAAEAVAGVRHHIALSVVGADGLPESGYLRAKLAQERLIKASPVPYTIVRATQFMEFLDGIANSAGGDKSIVLSSGLLQPIAADDVARAMADVALSQPLMGTLEIAGPEQFPLATIVANYLRAIGDTRTVTSDPQARYFGARLDKDSLVPQASARLGDITFESWLKARRQNAA